jgi:hypothetical protein
VELSHDGAHGLGQELIDPGAIENIQVGRGWFLFATASWKSAQISISRRIL